MNDVDARARRRWFAISAVRIAGMAGAVLGMILLARAADAATKAIAIALVLASLAIIALVPASLARRWRSDRP